MHYLPTFLACAIGVVLFQTLLFIVALIRRNNGIADIGWGLGFIIIGIISAYSYIISFDISVAMPEAPADPVFLILLTLVALWGLRLTIYLLIRNWSSPEDWRYARWREDWGKSFYIRSFLQVFMLQGFLMLVVGSPIILTGVDTEWSWHGYPYHAVHVAIASIGILLWFVGFFFQAVGDYQLFVFKKDPANKGKVMKYGVWKYTRHPNYFGESSMWWGIFLLSCISSHGVVGVLIRIIGPATITFMLLRVSGVVMLENKYKGNKEYEEYQKNTNSFIPMPTKKGAD